MKTLHSSFWLDSEDAQVIKERTKDPIALAKYQRVISNFVNILTGKHIPVEYRTHGESYTDSKRIVIGSNITDKTFDSVVGLALHEGSHIMLTDFSLIHSLASNINNETIKEGVEQQRVHWDAVKDLFNYVEDRRIDYYIYSNSPGYVGYYNAMYDRYFHNRDITSVLKSKEYRELTLDSYMFRIINFTNSASDLNALPDLDKIYNLIFDNVKQMSSSHEALNIAADVYEYILKNIDPTNTQAQEQQASQSHADKKEVSDAQLNRAKDRFEKQKKFIDGETTKGSVKKSEKTQISALAGNDTDIKTVEYDYYNTLKQEANVLVVRGINSTTKQLMKGAFLQYRDFEKAQQNIIEGINLGKRLGRKLQIRNYETVTSINRQKKGRIEKRRLHAAGADDFNIFVRNHVEKYDDAFIHISIDGSYSMSGTEFNNAIKSAIAIAQMGSMTTIDVQISIRYVISINGKDVPAMWIVYDSKKDSIATIKNNFKHLDVHGTTPEGICFDSILNELPTGSDSLKTYFLNYSDGMPNFQNYYGEHAVDHTARTISKMKKMGYNVLSFFVSSYDSELTRFRQMYGKDASTIDPTKLTSLASTLQKMFINKN
jgi:hypothetical protein